MMVLSCGSGCGCGYAGTGPSPVDPVAPRCVLSVRSWPSGPRYLALRRRPGPRARTDRSRWSEIGPVSPWAAGLPWPRQPGPAPGEPVPDTPVVVFSGSAHRPLAEAICDDLGVPPVVGRADPVQQRLPAGPAPGELPPARRLHRPAAGAAHAGAPDGAAADDRRGSRRQRGVDHRGDPLLLLRPVGQEGHSCISIGGRLVADMLATAGVHRVMTMTLHAPQVHGFFSVPVDQLTALGILAEHFLAQDLTRLDRRVAGLRQREDRDPVLAPARPECRGGLEAAGSPTTAS